MTDSLTPEDRSALMSKVRSGDTRPEWILRSALHRMGFRYSLRRRDLPGKPDLVFRRYRAVVFVHGCYWHYHRKGRCRRSNLPKSNTRFWRDKFDRNRRRDRANVRQLRSAGWRVMTVWECQLLDHTLPTVRKVADWLREMDASGKMNSPALRTRTQNRKRSYSDLDRRSLLRSAELKVRERIDGYSAKKKQQPR